ncbi:MAG: L-rhamnose mutarotase [Flavobacteriaceae bacterium]|nr:L-rhamnose mutarotase [Flavobacteriaceae bacterium]MCY4216517.1 L-rhamnose mutarotase [Flavobacteriaceae bacterium]MCY4254176.1 L-rhamnose mutarotase [Flavobacteriaceae bacterium]
MKNYALAVDMPDDKQLIEKYIEYHRNVWPEILKSIRDSGIINMKIYHIGNRLHMHITVNENFSFEQKNQMDLANPVVQKWEKLMSQFQIPIPWAKPGQKWTPLKLIFDY